MKFPLPIAAIVLCAVIQHSFAATAAPGRRDESRRTQVPYFQVDHFKFAASENSHESSYRKTLHALFDHPISGNIAFKDVVRLLEDFGATLEARSGARTAVTLNGQTATFHNAHHRVPKDEVVSIRHFLQHCGIDPAKYPV